MTAFEFGNPEYYPEVEVHAALTPGNQIVVSGNGLVLEYLANGRLNGNFGEAGRLGVESVAGAPFELDALASDAEGRIVIAGTVEKEGDASAAVLRFTQTGAPDPSFGGGDGVVVTDLGNPPVELGPSHHMVDDVHVTSMAVDRSGGIVVSGSAIRGSSYCWAAWGAYVARLTDNGDPDPDFGNGGVVLYKGENPRSADGLVLANGSAPLFFNNGIGCREESGFLVNRLSPDGSLDMSIHQGKRSVGWIPKALAVDGSGRMVLLTQPTTARNGFSGQKKSSVALVRMLPSGAFDPNFGRDGEATMRIPGPQSDLNDLVAARNGALLLVGTEMHSAPGHPGLLRRQLVVGRMGRDGTLDKRFGTKGLTRTLFGRGSETIGNRILLDGRGHAVVAGMVRSQKLTTGQGLALFRYDLKR
jgi:uncharacterized delta-60 repeat protein